MASSPHYARQKLNEKKELVDGDFAVTWCRSSASSVTSNFHFPGRCRVAVGGGGYFIIRNSWGCSGDGGYFYVPADYVSSLFTDLAILEIDGRRSARWNIEQ
jgi:hypothetical protein